MLGLDRCEGLHQLWGKRLRFQPHCKQAAQVLWNQLLILNCNLNLNLIRSNSSSVNLTPELSRWCLVGRALNPESSFITKRPSSNTLFVISACSLVWPQGCENPCGPINCGRPGDGPYHKNFQLKKGLCVQSNANLVFGQVDSGIVWSRTGGDRERVEAVWIIKPHWSQPSPFTIPSWGKGTEVMGSG